MTAIICETCATPAAPLDWRCAQCGGVLEIKDLPAFDPARIVADDFSLWRYRALLPVEQRVSLGEGLTPLVPTTLDDGMRILAKLEMLNPTGSYKDRGTVTMLNHMAAQGAREVVEDSSGNAGASVAAYSSALGIRARIFVPAHGAPAKKALIRAFGGDLMEVAGPQHAKTEACEEAARSTPYASHAWSPYFVLGQMTAAYEVWEQMGRRAPDAIVTPLGHGGLFLGFARGFATLHAAGLIERVPRMFAVQAAQSDPIVRGWESGADVPPVIETQPTIADGIIVKIPMRGRQVLAALRATGGAALRVSEEAIAQAQQQLFRCGLLAEPTSSVTVAALPQVRAHLGRDDAQIVCALTGNALKNVGR